LTLFRRHYYPQYYKIAALLLRTGGAYFDVGANVGFTAFPIVAELAPAEVEMHLFEANPACCRLLESTRAHHALEKMSIVNVCAADTRGTALLTVNASDTQAARMSDQGQIEVDQIKLDEYVQSKAVDKIALMKLDVEGFEPRVLRGLEATISSGRVRAIFTELSDPALALVGESAAAYLTQVRGYGFRTFYCRDEDRVAGRPIASDWQLLRINGASIPVAEAVEVWPGIHTDVLAISETSFLNGAAALTRTALIGPNRGFEHD
jgi:FkbM family methyltransferase